MTVDQQTLPAISVRQPWAWAICHADKLIENREWTSAPSYRGPILIHASKGCGKAEFHDAVEAILNIIRQAPGAKRLGAPSTLARMDIQRRGKHAGEGTWRPVDHLPFGSIVARARLVDVVHTFSRGCRVSVRGEGIICQLCGENRPESRACQKPDKWAVPGALGLILADVVPLIVPVPFKGSLGFFRVPTSELEKVATAALLAPPRRPA